MKRPVLAFLKRLIDRRKEVVTVLLFDNDNPHKQESYTLSPGNFFLFIIGIIFGVVIVVMLFFYITPLGTLIFNKEDRAVRESVIAISDRVQALQDSLEVRDRQLYDIQRIFRDNSDTTFEVRSVGEWRTMIEEEPQMEREVMTLPFTEQVGIMMLQSDKILYSEIFSGSVMFPAEPPVQGLLTNSYKPDEGHYGIDIAATKGADVRSIADGIVISSDWTFNNGYVMHISHGDGIVSVFKHFSEVFVTTGSVVRKGDLIGKVGETGLLASGPHIHFELWKNGASLDPALYINLN